MRTSSLILEISKSDSLCSRLIFNCAAILVATSAEIRFVAKDFILRLTTRSPTKEIAISERDGNTRGKRGTLHFASHPRVEIDWDNVLRGEELLVLVSEVNLPNVQQQYGFLFGCLNCVEPHRRDLGVHVGDDNGVDELLHSRQSRPVRLAAGVKKRGVLVDLLWETARRLTLPNCLQPDEVACQGNDRDSGNLPLVTSPSNRDTCCTRYNAGSFANCKEMLPILIERINQASRDIVVTNGVADSVVIVLELRHPVRKANE